MRRFVVAAALSMGLTFPLDASELENLSDGERQAFRDEVRAYLLENPEVLMEAIAVLEQRQTQAQGSNDAALIQVNASDLYEDGYSFVGGNPDGDIVMVEFLDYNCGFCRKAHPEVAELLKTDGNIRLIVKEFPILGEQSVRASRFAISVLQIEGPEAYKTVNDELMNFRGEYNTASLKRLAKSLDLDVDAIMDNMDDASIDEIIAKNRALAQRMQINGTPSFVMGDQMMRGYVPLDGMIEIAAQIRNQ